MIAYEEAIKLLTANVSNLPSELIETTQAMGRVVAKNIYSSENSPAFDNSAMDGFAFRFSKAQNENTQTVFQIKGVVAAGDDVTRLESTSQNECWEIMTGAALPLDCDSVIKVEDTKRNGTQVVFNAVLKQGSNVRKAGEDFAKEDLVVKKGVCIFAEHIMGLIGLGIDKIEVIKKPKVAVISTGAELTQEGPRAFGKIRNSTAPFLLTELSLLGTDVQYLGINLDDPKSFIDVLKHQVAEAVDVVISTGAVSMGKYDFISTALRDMGAQILFHKTAIRPGKPILFARLNRTAFFGLPGNPISTAMGLRFFVEPYLRALRGQEQEKGFVMALKNKIKKPEGLKCFFKAKRDRGSDSQKIEILAGQESFKIAPFMNADSWVVLPETGQLVEAGEPVTVFPVHSWGEK